MSVPTKLSSAIRHNWQKEEIEAIYQQPLLDLLFEAQKVHRANHPTNQVQVSKLLSIKTGTCPEDCKYCSQSGHHKTDIEKHKLLSKSLIVNIAKKAKANGATRFCMAAAWRSPPKKAMKELTEAVKAVKALGMETCLSAGMLNQEEANTLKNAGLDYYNHNLDTSPEYYPEITSTRKYQDRLDTLDALDAANLKSCCGGILGLGETLADRISFLHQLSNRPKHPESIPLNLLVPIPGTPLGETEPLDDLEFIRTVATARIIMPQSTLRLSAGRHTMSEQMHLLCFLAGANSIHSDQKLLTTPLPEGHADHQLLKRFGINAETLAESVVEESQKSVCCS